MTCCHCTDGRCACMFCGGNCQACAGRARAVKENELAAEISSRSDTLKLLKLDRSDPETIRFIADEVERDSKRHLRWDLSLGWSLAIIAAELLVIVGLTVWRH